MALNLRNVSSSPANDQNVWWLAYYNVERTYYKTVVACFESITLHFCQDNSVSSEIRKWYF
jgi:hypothetical protein